MYQVLVKETDKEMEELRKLLQKQKNEEEQVRDVPTNKCLPTELKVVYFKNLIYLRKSCTSN